MTRSPLRFSIVLTGVLSLTMAACGTAETPVSDASAAVDDSSQAPVIHDDALSPEGWREDAQEAAVAATPEDIAAEGVAAGHAMAETCGFTPAEVDRFMAQGSADQRGPGFEARVEQHMPRLRQAQQAQKHADSAAYQGNCDALRFMLENRG